MAISFLQAAQSTANETTYTFSSQNLGTADAGRYIVVAAHCNSGTTVGFGLSSVTVGGVAATIVVQQNNASGGFSGCSALAIAAVPTGTTGNIVVTWSHGAARCEIQAYRLTGIASATPADTKSSTASDPTASLDVPAGGVAIGAGCTSANTIATWTGLSEDSDAVVEGTLTSTSAHGEFVAQQTGLAITIDFGISGSANSPAGVFASWAPSGGGGSFVDNTRNYLNCIMGGVL